MTRRTARTQARPKEERPRARRSGLAPVVLGCSAAALALRALYLLDARDNPLWRYLGLDLQTYDTWARKIAGGHGLGEAPFTQAPFFPLALGATYAAAGADPVHALWVHAFVGAATAGLAAFLGCRWRGPVAGAIAGILVAIEKPAIFYTGVLLPTVWATFLTALALAAFQYALMPPAGGRSGTAPGASGGGPPLGRAALAGAALGLAGLAQPTVLALAAPALIALLAGRSAGRRQARAFAYSAGVAAVLSVSLAYNGVAGGAWSPIAVNGGVNLFIGNNEHATGAYVRPEGLREEADLLGVAAASRAARETLAPAEASAYWTRRAAAFVHDHPLRWAGLYGKKLCLFFMNLEIPQVEYLRFEERYSTLLRLPLPGLWLLLGLAASGAVLLLRRDAWARFLCAGLLALAAGVAVFFVTARFRLVAVPFLAVLAGGAVDAARSAARRPVAMAAAVGTVAAMLSLTNPFHIALSEGEGNFYFRAAAAAQRDGRIAEAMDGYREALRLSPRLVQAHVNLGSLLAGNGHPAEALPHFEEAASLDPQNAAAHYGLAQLAHMAGDAGRAIDEYRHTLALDPANVPAREALATVLYAIGRAGEARTGWATIARAGSPENASSERARFFLALFSEREDDPGWETIDALRQGDLRLADGDRVAAAEHYHQALAAAPGSLSARRALEKIGGTP